MNLKKIVAAFAAAAMAVTMTAVSAFASTVELDAEYPGAWTLSKPIPKSEFAAIGGDVKVVVTVETKEPLIGSHNHLARPMTSTWGEVDTHALTSDTAIAKEDGFMVFTEGQTSLEFVVPESVWSTFVGYDEENPDDGAGLAFQVCDVIIKSAELSAGAPEADITRVSEEESAQVMDGTYAAAAPAAEEAAPAVEEAPAADTAATAPAATGNTSAAAIVAVMALAGAAAVVSKRK